MPGQVHSVWSQTDCLMVGAHLYTAATFAASLECIHRQLSGESHSNEDPNPEDWETLTMILKFLDDRDIFTEAESKCVCRNLKYLIQSPQLRSHWKSLKPSSNPAALSSRQQSLSSSKACYITSGKLT